MDAWLRGPIEGVPPRLMAVAHGLVHALEDVERAAATLTVAELWAHPGDAASVGFHLRHIAGVVDRLFTYARDESLNDEQFGALAAERLPGSPVATAEELIARVRVVVAAALGQLRETRPASLLDRRAVGRARMRSNVLGLLPHAAGHAERHAGQVGATAKIVRALAAARVRCSWAAYTSFMSRGPIPPGPRLRHGSFAPGPARGVRRLADRTPAQPHHPATCQIVTGRGNARA